LFKERHGKGVLGNEVETDRAVSVVEHLGVMRFERGGFGFWENEGRDGRMDGFLVFLVFVLFKLQWNASCG